jgi:xyloglucan-specific exo-beta-1,4-glucanase
MTRHTKPTRIAKSNRNLRSAIAGYAGLAFALALTQQKLSAEPYLWDSAAMGGGGYVSGLLAHPGVKDLIYARTDVGGAYRWEEAGQRWMPLLDWTSEAQTSYQGVESMAIDPRSPDSIYLTVGTSYWNSGKSAVLRSHDRGQTWSITDVTAQFKANGNGGGRGVGERLAVDPNLGSVLMTGTRAHGLWKSTDSGVTWTKVSSFPVTTTADGTGISFVTFVPASGTAGSATPNIYVGVSRDGLPNLYRSTDGGTTWAVVPTAPTTAKPFRASHTGTKLYVTYARTSTSPDRLGVLRFDVNSNTFTDITPSSSSFYLAHQQSYGSCVADPTNQNRLVATTVGYYNNQTKWGWGDAVALSLDAGVTWKRVFDNSSPVTDNGMPFGNGHALHWASSMVMDPFNPSRLFITSGHGVVGTDNLGETAASTTWEFQARGIEETVNIAAAAIPTGGMIAGFYDYSGFAFSDPTVPADSFRPNDGTASALAVASQAPGVWLRVCGAKILLTENAGATWTQLPFTAATVDKGSIALSANGGTILYQPAGGTATYRTDNRGSSWSIVQGLTFSGRVLADPVNSLKFYIHDRTTSGKLHVSTNGGTSFTPSGFIGINIGNVLAATPGMEGHLWMPLGSSGLLRSTNSGLTFQPVANVKRATSVALGKKAPARTYPSLFIWGNPLDQYNAAIAAGTPANEILGGMYRSTTEGVGWIRVNDETSQFGGLANGQFITADQHVFGRAYLSTAGRGLAYGTPDYELRVASSPWIGITDLKYTLPDDYVSGTPVSFEVTGSASSGIYKYFTDLTTGPGANSIRLLHSKYYPVGTYRINMIIEGQTITVIDAIKGQ